jgi:hypothetical protein
MMRQDEDGRNLGGKVLRVPRNRDRTTFEAEWRNKVQGRTDPLVRFTSLSLMSHEPISDYLTETVASPFSHKFPFYASQKMDPREMTPDQLLALYNENDQKRFCLDRFLFKVTFDTDGTRGFSKDPAFAPMATPAFLAGNPNAPLNLESRLLHCGGSVKRRDASPYISCSRDLFWCLWRAVKAILEGTTKYAEIFFIADGKGFDDMQTRVYGTDAWLGSHGLVDEYIRDRAVKLSRSASEVLVHHRIGRERIIEGLYLDYKVLKQSHGTESPKVTWIWKEMEDLLADGYSEVARSIFKQDRYESAHLAEWCEFHGTRFKSWRRVCIVRELYKGLDFKYETILSYRLPWWVGDDFRDHLLNRVYLPSLDCLENHEFEHGDQLERIAIEEADEERQMEEFLAAFL